MSRSSPISTLAVAAALGLLTASAHAEGSLSVYAWADSIAPDMVAKFEKETGIKVTVDAFSSNEDLLTKLQAGSSGYDIVTPSQHFVKIMVDSGLLENIDASSMEAFQQILPEYQKQWWDPTGNYSVPLAFGNAGYTVNRDLYKGPVDSWKYYFEPSEELKGKIASLAQPDEVIPAAQNYLGIPYCSEDPQAMKKVLDLLMAQKPFVTAYSSDNIENRIGSGEVALEQHAQALRRLGQCLETRDSDGTELGLETRRLQNMDTGGFLLRRTLQFRDDGGEMHQPLPSRNSACSAADQSAAGAARPSTIAWAVERLSRSTLAMMEAGKPSWAMPRAAAFLRRPTCSMRKGRFIRRRRTRPDCPDGRGIGRPAHASPGAHAAAARASPPRAGVGSRPGHAGRGCAGGAPAR